MEFLYLTFYPFFDDAWLPRLSTNQYGFNNFRRGSPTENSNQIILETEKCIQRRIIYMSKEILLKAKSLQWTLNADDGWRVMRIYPIEVIKKKNIFSTMRPFDFQNI